MLDIGNHRERNRLQIWVGCTPVEVGELVVDGATEDLGIAIFELVIQLAECCDFGGAYESEVLRVEEDDAPLALIGLVVDLLEVVFGLVGVDLAQVSALQRGQFEIRELVTDRQQCHCFLLLVSVIDWLII